MQETDFRVEIVIGEDCSTDGTAAVLQSLQLTFPGTIRLLHADKNMGAMANGKRAFAAAKGKYLALLEGDDFWTDRFKLQRQVELLEQHRDLVGCFHSVRWLEQKNGQFRDELHGPPIARVEYDVDELLSIGNFVPTGSILYRAAAVLPLPSWLRLAPYGDLPILVFAMQKGRLGFLPDVMGVYRRNEGSMLGSQTELFNDERLAQTYEVMGTHLKLRRHAAWQQGISKVYYILTAAYAHSGAYRSALRSLFKVVETSPRGMRVRLFILALKSIIPPALKRPVFLRKLFADRH